MVQVFADNRCPLVLLVDETLERRRGKKIKAKRYYRDAVRSSQSRVVNTMGLKWLVMAISVKLPLMSTDPLMTPERMIELFIDRWGLEVTFEESREHLGVETQRQWSDRAIARSTPTLMGLYSCICLMANQLKQVEPLKAETTSWHSKEHIALFSYPIL
jgi:hypothetical protein